jgi:hypothetical protein
MKIKLDENLPHRLAPALEKIGHDVHTLQHESLVGIGTRNLGSGAARVALLDHSGFGFLGCPEVLARFPRGDTLASLAQSKKDKPRHSSSYSVKRLPTIGWVASSLLQNARFGFF